MKYFYVIVIGLCSFSLSAQDNSTLYLKDSTCRAEATYTVEPNYMATDNDVTLLEYSINPIFSINADTTISIHLLLKDSSGYLSIKDLNQPKATPFKSFVPGVQSLALYNSQNKETYTESFDIKVSGQLLSLISKHAWYSKETYGGKTYHIRVLPYFSIQGSINITTTNFKVNQFEVYNLYEPLEMNNRYVQFEQLNYHKKEIQLNAVEHYEGKYGYKEGKYIEIADTLLKYVEHQSLNPKKPLPITEYYLLYFWGEWCKPCVDKIPLNHRFYNILNRQKVTLINISLNQGKESQDRTIGLIQENDIKGRHILEDFRNNKLINHLSVTTYPSYILLDTKGKVIYRSETNPKKITEKLQQLGLLKK